MKRLFLTTTLVACLGFAVSAQAQTSPPVGGSDAKGNAPLKTAHTVNDGSAKPGANSFTEGQARQHILNSGYTTVTGLTKGKDGVWRGMATRNGAQMSVAMDFKGNVTDVSSTAAAGGGAAPMTGEGGKSGVGMNGAETVSSASAAGDTMQGSRRHHHHRRHHHRGRACAHPGVNGVACSGVSTLRSGVSDKEEHALQAGAHP